jgi:hypothetical protein
MEFPLTVEEWTAFDAESFLAAEARDPGGLGMELLSQIRGNGRVMDHSRVVLGGSQLLEADIRTGDVCHGFGSLSETKLKFQYWPRDIKIRRNMSTSDWSDVWDLISRREVQVTTERTEVDAATVVELLGREDTRREAGAVVRWAVVIGQDRTMRLELQSLPARLESISGKPLLHG